MLNNRFVSACVIALALLVGNLAFYAQSQGSGGAQHDLCRITLGNVNLKTVANTTVYTTPSGQGNFHILMVVTEVTAATSFTVGATLSLGTNGASYNNIIASFTSQTALNANTPTVPAAGAVSVPPSTAIVANVTGGATATTATAHFSLIGYFQ
jgi:hypothetical protein